MKTIKVILGIIIGLSLVFFATGLVVKETTYTTQVIIEKPVKEVFETFNTEGLVKEWIPDLISIKPLETKPGKVGSTYEMIINNNGQEIKLVEKVLAYVPEEKVTLFFKADSMLKTDDYTFTFENDKTTIVNKSTCRGSSYILSCLFPYFKGTFQEQDQGYLNNFKSYIETNK